MVEGVVMSTPTFTGSREGLRDSVEGNTQGNEWGGRIFSHPRNIATRQEEGEDRDEKQNQSPAEKGKKNNLPLWQEVRPVRQWR